MPIYDRQCSACERVEADKLERIDTADYPCTELACAGTMKRVWIGRGNSVISDDIPGGILIKNGMCWPDGTPRKFYSKTELYREAERQGYVNRVEHKGGSGGDRSKHTSRWV